jgi:hypothetical protein
MTAGPGGLAVNVVVRRRTRGRDAAGRFDDRFPVTQRGPHIDRGGTRSDRAEPLFTFAPRHRRNEAQVSAPIRRKSEPTGSVGRSPDRDNRVPLLEYESGEDDDPLSWSERVAAQVRRRLRLLSVSCMVIHRRGNGSPTGGRGQPSPDSPRPGPPTAARPAAPPGSPARDQPRARSDRGRYDAPAALGVLCGRRTDLVGQVAGRGLGLLGYLRGLLASRLGDAVAQGACSLPCGASPSPPAAVGAPLSPWSMPFFAQLFPYLTRYGADHVGRCGSVGSDGPHRREVLRPAHAAARRTRHHPHHHPLRLPTSAESTTATDHAR